MMITIFFWRGGEGEGKEGGGGAIVSANLFEDISKFVEPLKEKGISFV